MLCRTATSFFSDLMYNKALSIFKKDFIDNAEKIIIAFLVVAFMDLTLGTVCAAKLLFGIPCPFCGLTRAGIELLTFDFKSAWMLNPLIFYITVLLVLWCLQRYLDAFPKRALTFLLVALVAIAVPLYIYRWILLFPHTEPMSYRESNLLNLLKI